MTRRNILMCVFMLCIVASANNIESWSTIQVSKKIDDVIVGASEEARIGVDKKQTTKKIDELHTTAFIDFIASDNFTLGVQDDYVLLRDGTDARHRRDNRPGVNVAASCMLHGFKFLNRSRFICRDLEDERPYFRYRNLSKVYTPALVESRYAKSIKLFTAYEWYFDEGSKDRYLRKNDKFNQFWLDAGVQANVFDAFTVELFYRLVEVKSSSNHDWSPGHAICVCVSKAF